MSVVMTITGFIAKNPEVKKAKTGSEYTVTSMAINPRVKGGVPMWVNITAFGKTAEQLGKFSVGEFAVISGSFDYNVVDGKSFFSLTANQIIKTPGNKEKKEEAVDEVVDGTERFF